MALRDQHGLRSNRRRITAGDAALSVLARTGWQGGCGRVVPACTLAQGSGERYAE